MCVQKGGDVFNVSEEARVEFLDRDGSLYILSPNLKFCGRLSYGKCNSDGDCVRAGCSGQICQSRLEKSVITTCEWLECYDTNKYGVACKCIDGKCQWVEK